jgi:long-chain acyl-CoA synthetase
MKKEYALNRVPDVASVQDMIVNSAARYGDKIALEDLKETPISKATYRSLLKYILKFGTALKTLGIRERSHIAVIGENRVQWGISYLSAMCFNYVIVPIDRNLPINEVLNIIHEADVVAIIFSDTFDSVFRERKASLKNLKCYIGMDLPAAKDGFHSMRELIESSAGCRVEDLPKINPNEEAEIIFTSGSLGRAKGVMLSQKNIAANLFAMVRMFAIYPEDRFLSVLPMHHTYECTCGFLCPLYGGASAHYARSLKTVVEDLQSVKATMLLGVPLLFDKMFKRIYRTIHEKKITSLVIGPLIKVSDFAERVGWRSFKKIVFKEIHRRFGGSIRCFIAGGAAQDPIVAKGLREFGFNFAQGYGLTEASPILALNRIDLFKDDAAGLPLPDVELVIHEPDSEGVGEVWAKGDNIMVGYYKNASATKDAFEDGWFKTGDLGRIDDEGFLHICGRKKNVIISKNGKNVYPEEIEDVLNRSPFVLESYVYGEEDAKQNEIIAAQIVVDAEAFIELSELNGVKITPELIHEMIADEIKKTNRELPIFKQIKTFKIREQEFEKTTTQKIKRYLVGKN